jgi:Na+-driven multidrug efflux pump
MLTAGCNALRFFAPFFIIGSLGFTLEVIFTHNGWGRFVLMADIVTNVLFTIGFTLAAVRIFHAQVRTAWLGFGLYFSVYTLVLVIGFYSKRWARLEVDSVT